MPFTEMGQAWVLCFMGFCFCCSLVPPQVRLHPLGHRSATRQNLEAESGTCRGLEDRAYRRLWDRKEDADQ